MVPGAPGLVPVAAHPLFQGATFNAGYNANRSAVHVATPSGLRRAVLAALITGAASSCLLGYMN